nr:hypothetical protein [Tanacetum cinerariifolium]
YKNQTHTADAKNPTLPLMLLNHRNKHPGGVSVKLQSTLAVVYQHQHAPSWWLGGGGCDEDDGGGSVVGMMAVVE